MYFPQHNGRVKFRFIPGYPLTGNYNPSAPWTWSGINQLYNKNFGPPVFLVYERKGIMEGKVLVQGKVLGERKGWSEDEIQFFYNKNTFYYLLYYKVLAFNSKISKILFCGYIIILTAKHIPDWWKGSNCVWGWSIDCYLFALFDMGCWRISARIFLTFVLIEMSSFRGAFSFKAFRNFFTSFIYCRWSILKYSIVRSFIHNQFTRYIIFYKSITIYIPLQIMGVQLC